MFCLPYEARVRARERERERKSKKEILSNGDETVSDGVCL